jgi:small subunit ribosomal protein S9
VRLVETDATTFEVNGQDVAAYFPTAELRNVATEALRKLELPTKYTVSAVVRGGGKSGQAEAMRLGVARALISIDLDLRGKLKPLGFLTRDPRKVERKHFGRKKARKGSQWSKR